jgi:septum formation inhibitor-activating ATPase MinD
MTMEKTERKNKNKIVIKKYKMSMFTKTVTLISTHNISNILQFPKYNTIPKCSQLISSVGMVTGTPVRVVGQRPIS